MDQYWWYQVQGFAGYGKEGELLDAVSVGVYAASEEEALEKAQGRVHKALWRVQSVTEHQPALDHPEAFSRTPLWPEPAVRLFGNGGPSALLTEGGG